MSPIRRNVREISAYVPGEQIHDPGWIKLNTNENPYGPSPAVAAFLRNVNPQALHRYPDPDCSKLRQRIAEHHHCRSSQVFIGNGSDEILALCTRAFVEDHRTIAFFEPSYSLYAVLAAIRAVASHPVPLGPDFKWRDPAVDDADLFFLTSPNAPTGMTYPRDKIEAFCHDFAGIVVIDEAYADFADSDCVDLALRLPNVLIVRTFSKAYALAAIRCGYIIGAANLIDALFAIKDSYNVNSLTQGAALAAFEDHEHKRRSTERICHDRQRLAEFLQGKRWTVYPSQTNFLWIKPCRITAEQLFEALREKRILTRWFAAPETRDYLRITIGTETEINRLIEILNVIAP